MNSTDGCVVSRRSKPPLDVRIVAYYLYLMGFLSLAMAVLLGSGIAKPLGSFAVLAGTVQITSGLIYSVYTLCISSCNLLCAWGLMRRVKFAWWLSLISQIYLSVEWVLTYSKYPCAAHIIGVVNMAIVVWLLFRRGLYIRGASQGQPSN